MILTYLPLRQHSQYNYNPLTTLWIADQLSHTSIAMLKNHPAKFMKKEIPDMQERGLSILKGNLTHLL